MADTALDKFESIDGSKLGELSHLSNFEVTADFRKIAPPDNLNGNEPIDVGRGNPNWINTTARLAQGRMVEFGIKDSERTFTKDNGAMAGYIEMDGIEDRFKEFMNPENPADQLLLNTVKYATDELGINGDEMVHEMADGAIGNHYPVPSRSLVNVEKILNKYLEKALYRGAELANETELFPTEGGAASMVYIFNEMKLSHILEPGDKVAINTPIFTPYLEIPILKEYNLEIVPLLSSEDNDWQMTDEQLDQLKDPSIKAFFDVNPTNPAARAFSNHALDKIKEVVEANPKLTIVTDDVYGTFAEGFKTIYSVVPHNTLLVYSFSKLFGVTGHRLGLTAAHKDNVFDQIIAEKTAANPEIKAEFEDRYSKVVTDPLHMKFIDRMVADSRAIGLYHVAGLSTPQQIMMELLAANNLTVGDDTYLDASREVVGERYNAFWNGLGVDADESEGNTKYYTLINIPTLMEKSYNKDFSDWYVKNYNYLDFSYRLVREFGAVIMDASSFGANEGYVRISLANMPTESYAKIAEYMKELLAQYYAEYQKIINNNSKSGL
ncbi:bifunctional aspartate transaminase/aspartate 4-decarboxylase [Lentilactobacillus senioris]|uniref:bifunctional aspartate transaminase/aspartate 4-decarboxylase n=1 Tax=Lentilactobacillus senioris TaxID=931534 RepID=UPI0006D0570D|nr:bifunctional aspartate transaminase/aspartate 4-decarboxylase [Lentilactobacillus senioris]